MHEPTTVYVPQDGTVFEVELNSIVRLTASVVAGGQIEESFTGPAEIVAESRQVTVREGHVLIGSDVRLYDFKPKGPGLVQVDFKTIGPVPGSIPDSVQYLFNVK
jgi:hypothetical protein